MKVTVKVPATSANVGPAFDCAGFAVNLYNEITVERKLAKPFSCRAEGEFSGEAFKKCEIRLFTDANGTLEESFDLGLVQKTKNEFFKKVVEKFTENGQKPLFLTVNGDEKGRNGDFSDSVKDSGFINVDFACEKNVDFVGAARVGGCDFVPETFEITVKTNVPPARGLGSSATIIVGVLKGLNALYGNVLTDRELAEAATAVEGHPDNVVPALFGGFVFSFAQDDGKVDFSRHNFISGVKIFALIPDFELKTSVSRGVLPKMIKYETAVYNLKQTAELFAALTKNDKALFSKALHDKLHQPYREKCIPGMSVLIRQIPCAAGVLGCVLSGAGPTLAVFSEGGRIELEKIAGDVWQRSGIKFEIKELEPDNEGATVIFDE
ncbi:MAG: homoserine kinase [Candidatus Gastranaerophilaceae bacterium]